MQVPALSCLLLRHRHSPRPCSSPAISEQVLTLLQPPSRHTGCRLPPRSLTHVVHVPQLPASMSEAASLQGRGAPRQRGLWRGQRGWGVWGRRGFKRQIATPQAQKPHPRPLQAIWVASWQAQVPQLRQVSSAVCGLVSGDLLCGRVVGACSSCLAEGASEVPLLHGSFGCRCCSFCALVGLVGRAVPGMCTARVLAALTEIMMWSWPGSCTAALHGEHLTRAARTCISYQL